MKYINKEYGFAFRPPFSDKFREVAEIGPEIGEENYPQKYITGVGYDYGAVNGAMLVGKHGSMWGVRVLYFSRFHNRWMDNDDLVVRMSNACSNTANGDFARFASGPLTVRWVRRNDNSVLLQVSSHRKLRVRVVFYSCYDCTGEMSIEGARVSGRSPYVAIVPGTIELTDNNAVYRGRYMVLDDDSREYFHAMSYMPPSASLNGADGEAMMEFVINSRQPSVYLCAAVGDKDVFDAEMPRLDSVKLTIQTNERHYADNKTAGTGTVGGAVERMLNAVLWSRVYYPYLMTEIYTSRRSVLDKHFDIGGAEENCSAILGCYTDADKSVRQLKFTAEDKVMAVFAAWHNYMHMQDRTEMLLQYRRLTKLYPPIASVVVADEDKNEVAYKWSDSPLKELSEPAPMFSLDMSSLKLLAFDVLERIAALFDLPEKEKYATVKSKMISLINETFWCESEGIYKNRYVSGQWASAVGATSFYPLIAGAVDTPEKLSHLINNLTNPRRFWDEYVIPTVSIDNREYGRMSKPDNNGKKNPAYLDYRGSIVPYVNFLVYHGLKRYGLDEIASAFAQKSVELWATNAPNGMESYSVFLPHGSICRTDEYISANGNMLALIGLQELIDLEYFRPDLKRALRFGTFLTGVNTLKNFKLAGHTYSIEVTDESTVLEMDGVKIFDGAGGKFVVRNFLLDGKGGCEFMVSADQNISVNLEIPTADKKSVKYFFIVPTGKSVVRASGGMVNLTSINAQ